VERQLTIADLKNNLSRALGDVANGDVIVVSRNGVPIVRMTPIQPAPSSAVQTTGDAIVFLAGDRPRFNLDRPRAIQIIEDFEAGNSGFVIEFPGHNHLIFPRTALDHVLIPNSMGGTGAPPSRLITLTTNANVRFFIHEQSLSYVDAAILHHKHEPGTGMVSFPTFDRPTSRWGVHQAHIPTERVANVFIGGEQ
jgi:prevent-host-death family protein